MDPLVLLQDYASRRDLSKVRLKETRVEFEDAYTFPRDTLTAYTMGEQGFYSLDTLLVFLLKGVSSDPATGARLLAQTTNTQPPLSHHVPVQHRCH